MELLNNYLFKDLFKLSSLKIKSTFQVDVMGVYQNLNLPTASVNSEPFDILLHLIPSVRNSNNTQRGIK